MEQIINLGEIDFWNWFVTGFVIIFGIIAIYKIVIEVSVMIKKPIGIAKQRKADHELTIHNSKAIQELAKKHEEDTTKSIHNDELIRDDLKILTETVNNIAKRFELMQQKNNETKLKELKDTLINYYNKYRVVGEWTKLEKDAFWDLFDDYEKRGGNGYIHSIVEPVMRELKEID
jgi:hypothetical protein